MLRLIATWQCYEVLWITKRIRNHALGSKNMNLNVYEYHKNHTRGWTRGQKKHFFEWEFRICSLWFSLIIDGILAHFKIEHLLFISRPINLDGRARTCHFGSWDTNIFPPLFEGASFLLVLFSLALARLAFCLNNNNNNNTFVKSKSGNSALPKTWTLCAFLGWWNISSEWNSF